MQIAACRFGILSLGIILLTGTAVQTAHGAGFRIPEVSITGLATSDALVANPNEFGALPYNPAAMSYHEVLGISAGLILISPNVTATPTGSGSTDSNASSIIPVPNLYAMGKIQPDFAWGIGVNSPFGLETKWADGTFPGFGLDPALGFVEPEETKIEMININPNVSYKIDKLHSSIALGIDYYNVMEVVLNTQLTDINGDGDGWGWNAAYMYNEGPFSVGLSFRSKVKVDIEGTFDPTKAGMGIPPSSMETPVTFPEMLQVGVRYEILPTLSLEFDVERTGWDTVEETKISHSSLPLANPYIETANWNDVFAYRFGGIYELNPTMKILFGYSYDNTPQGDNYFTP